MSAAVSYQEYGGPEVLEVIDVPETHAGPGEVRVAVRAAGLNPFDFKVRRGGYIPNHSLPSRQGAEFAGVIDEVGDGVQDWAVGDEVLGWINRGAQAEYVVVPQAQVAAKPEGLDWGVAGSIGLVANTAKRSVDSLALGPDDTVLVTAAAGGVGIMTVQFVKATGATVVGTASEAHHDALRELGVIPVAYGEGELDRLRAASPNGYTAALDTIGGDAIRTALALGISPEKVNTVADHGAIEEFGVQGIGGGKKTSAELAEFARQAAEGELIVPIRSTYHLPDVVDAFRDLETGHGLGKVVLLIP
ncbi:MAG: NADP-dependent oxidoreductase [Terrimesophilobacter sp.]